MVPGQTLQIFTDSNTNYIKSEHKIQQSGMISSDEIVHVLIQDRALLSKFELAVVFIAIKRFAWKFSPFRILSEMRK